MPAAAVIGAAAIGGGASLLGASRQSRAAENAADASAEAARTTAASNERMMERQIGLQEPFRQLGVSAINPLSDLLGLNYQTEAAPQANTQMQTQPAQGMQFFMQPDGSMRAGNVRGVATRQPQTLEGYLNGYGGVNANNFARNAPNLPAQTQTPAQTSQPTAPRPSALEALQDRPGYNFRFNEGQRALDSSAAARGMTMSGANIKAQTRYGQDYASNEYDREINRLLAVMGGGQVATNNQQSAIGQAGALNQQATLNAGNARASAYQQQGQAWANGIGGAANAITGGIGAYGGIKGWFGG
jgi:hypothetical protein